MRDKSRAKDFWEHKILRWETSRYSPWLSAYPLSWTIRSRLRAAARELRKRLPAGGSVTELGCGSGYLATTLVGHAARYLGIDIAANAIAVARERVREKDFVFKAEDVLEAALPESDVTVFLGLTDWLSEAQLDALVGKLRSNRVLFSYTSASRANPYRLYRLLMDRPVDESAYRARTFTKDEIEKLLAKHGYQLELLTAPSAFNPGALAWALKKT